MTEEKHEITPPEFENDQDIRPLVEAHNKIQDLTKPREGKAPLLVASVCVGDMVVALYAVRTPCVNAYEKEFLETTYELHFHSLNSGEHAMIPIRGENDALCMFASWIMMDETQHTIERCYKRMVAALGDKAKVFMV